ncbi:MAG: universal stress protein, partial [Chloroflexi bacterium]|nr:universal stress protein [Chloroflexota bacterium]
MPDVERQIFSHILVPLDGSAEANIAVAQACTLAASSGATITLVRVVSSAKEVTDAEAFLADIARQYATSNQRIETVARDGDAASAIVEEIRRRGADLVVMRTRGRSGLTRAVLGSVAEQMVKNSPTPVWLLPPGVRAARALESILVPVDGSPGGSLALGIARELAAHSGTGTRLSLLQVVVPMPLYFGHDVMHGPVYVDPYWDEVAQTTAREYVTSIATQLGKTGIRA